MENVKEMVKQKYSEIAANPENNASCCETTCCGDVNNIMADDYTKLEGYEAMADLGLGCGLPTQFAKIKKGDIVLDLGSGAGNDAFIARHETGETGKVIGVDFSEPMLERARKNAETRGFNNVEFRQGDIENLPVTDNSIDVVVSNCVLNLVPNKEEVFNEIFRVLKKHGHFSISDIVLVGDLPSSIQSAAEMYAGCVAGAIQKDEYLALINKAGFENVVLQKEKVITLPDEVSLKYLSEEEAAVFKQSGTGIFSITVYGEKVKDCCGSGCCS